VSHPDHRSGPRGSPRPIRPMRPRPPRMGRGPWPSETTLGAFGLQTRVGIDAAERLAGPRRPSVVQTTGIRGTSRPVAMVGSLIGSEGCPLTIRPRRAGQASALAPETDHACMISNTTAQEHDTWRRATMNHHERPFCSEAWMHRTLWTTAAYGADAPANATHYRYSSPITERESESPR